MSQPALSADASGLQFDSAPAPSAVVDVKGLPDALAAYWQHWKDVGSKPANSVFWDGGFTTVLGQMKWAHKQKLRAGGFGNSATYRAEPAVDGILDYAARDGERLVCGTVRYHAEITGSPVRPLIQPPNRSFLDPLHPPGAYSSVKEEGLHMSCFDFVAAAAAPVEVIGDDGGVISVEGVLAPVSRALNI